MNDIARTGRDLLREADELLTGQKYAGEGELERARGTGSTRGTTNNASGGEGRQG